MARRKVDPSGGTRASGSAVDIRRGAAGANDSANRYGLLPRRRDRHSTQLFPCAARPCCQRQALGDGLLRGVQWHIPRHDQAHSMLRLELRVMYAVVQHRKRAVSAIASAVERYRQARRRAAFAAARELCMLPRPVHVQGGACVNRAPASGRWLAVLVPLHVRVRVGSRVIDRSFLKESGFDLVILLELGDGGNMPDILLGDVLIIEVEILEQSGFQMRLDFLSF